MIDLTPEHLVQVQQILQNVVAGCEVRVFGSRYWGQAKPYSDLDIAILGPSALPVQTMRTLREAFAESNLPFRVDVLDWHATSPEFQAVILRGYESLRQ